MHFDDSETQHKLALQAERDDLRRGPQGRIRVRPAARLGTPYDQLQLQFGSGTLSVQAGSGTNYASSSDLDLSPQLPLAPYVFVWPDILNFEIDDAALGGSFVSFLALKLDDDSEVQLNGTQMIASSGAASVSGPLFNDAAALGAGRLIKSARVRLQANGPGSATASLALGLVEVYLLRGQLGQTFTA